MGVKFLVEHHRSLGTRDRTKVGKAYAEKRAEIEAVWTSWEEVLRSGPLRLTHRNTVALAGERAVKFFETHEDDPTDAPPGVELGGHEIDALLSADKWSDIPQANAKAFLADMAALPLGREATLAELLAILRRHPAIIRDIMPSFAKALAHVHGDETDEVLSGKGLTVDGVSRMMLNFEMAIRSSYVRRGLAQREVGDWGRVEGLHALPTYKPQVEPSQAPRRNGRNGLDLTFDMVIAEQERLSKLHLDKHQRSPRTFRKYREDCQRFVEWRGGSASLLTVTLAEAAKWRDEMLTVNKLRRKTMILRLTGLRAVIGWAMQHNKRRGEEGEAVDVIFPDGNPLKGMDLPEKQKVESEERTHSKEHARILLLASRKETDASRRWVPWLIAYSGMRIGEACQLEKADVLEADGHPYLMVRDDDIRSTKTHQSRRIPLHKAIVSEGFLDFVKAAPSGRLFPASRADNNVRKWAHKVMKPHGGFRGKPPFHGSRHLFGDMAIGKLDMAARYYIEGRAFPGSGKDYGRSAAMVPELARMMDTIEPLLSLPRVSNVGSDL